MRAARTPTSPENRATKVIGARVTPDLYAAVTAEAEAEGVTVSHYVTRVLSAAVAA